ncbi:MAG: hypothetical protein PHW69_04170 [Elusimicrobiaceae bacterium]|nr:hypothetical protein [Elusimicrobiaceae bacterium]
MNGPYRIYAALISSLGPQGWWPVTPAGKFRPEYKRRGFYLKTERERFEVAAGAILTQNTTWKNAEKAIINLNLAGGATAELILAAPPEKLRELIRPSGYYTQKEKKLRIFAEHVVRRHGGRVGEWLGGPFDAVRAELLALWGIGPETADSILLYAGERVTFVVDAYTLRLARRMGWLRNADYDLAKRFFENSLPRELKIFNEFHALTVALGKDFCRPKPHCADCPLTQMCAKLAEE